jgi:hypothetical protein
MTPSTDARATKRGETKGRGNKRPNLRLVTNPGDNVGRLKAARAKLTSRELLYLDGLGVLSLAVLLNAFGLVMVLSSSTVASINTAGTPWSLFEKQLMWTAIGAVCCLIAVHMPLYRLRKLSIPLLLVVIVLLGLVFFPEFGSTVGGSSRWIDLGPLQIQPSEFAKLALVLFLSDLAVRRQKVRDEFKAIFIPALLALGLLALLIVKQPDLGTAIVLTCIAASVLFAAGVRRGTLIGVIGSLALIGIVLATDESYRRERFLAFMHPMANASGSGYQLAQSLIALGSGTSHRIGHRRIGREMEPVDERLDGLHLRDRRQRARAARRDRRHRRLRRLRLLRTSHRPANHRSVLFAPCCWHHCLDRLPGVHQHRGRGGSAS